MNDHYDVIVIGSGAGGGTMTYALAPTGAKILLLERGDWLPREAENWSPAAVWAEGRYHNSGSWTDQDGNKFEPKQNYYVGGNTKFYGAVLFRFRERDFEAIEHVDGVSPAWPIRYADLEPWYARAERLYQVHGERGIDPTEPPAVDAYPYPAISNEPRIEQLHRDLADAGLNPFPLPNGILIDEAAPQFSACVRCATCDGFPCLVNGKADSQVICVEPALRYPNVTLRTGALVSPRPHSVLRIVRACADPTHMVVDVPAAATTNANASRASPERSAAVLETAPVRCRLPATRRRSSRHKRSGHNRHVRITYNRDADAAYIRLGDAEAQPAHRTTTTRAELPPGLDGFIALDWDGEHLVGIEILDASTRISPAILEQAEPLN